MKNSFDKAKATVTLVNGVSSALGYVHAASTILADLAVQGEVRIKSKYLGKSEIEVAEARSVETIKIQLRLGLRSTLATLSENLED